MKKLLVSTMAAIVAFGSVNALADSFLAEYNDIQVVGEDAFTREELLRMPNDIQLAEMEKKRQEEELAKQQAASAGEVVEEQPEEEVVVEQPKVEPIKRNSFNTLERIFGNAKKDASASAKKTTSLTEILSEIK